MYNPSSNTGQDDYYKYYEFMLLASPSILVSCALSKGLHMVIFIQSIFNEKRGSMVKSI